MCISNSNFKVPVTHHNPPPPRNHHSLNLPKQGAKFTTTHCSYHSDKAYQYVSINNNNVTKL